MNRAFIKENDDLWLGDIDPTMNALLVYLTRENNGIRVYEQETTIDTDGREIHTMSNGLSYTRNKDGRWQVVY